MGESDVPQINCMFIIGQLIHHAYSSTSGPHALQLFIKSNNVLHHSNLRCMSCSLFFFFSLGDMGIPQCLPHFKALSLILLFSL